MLPPNIRLSLDPAQVDRVEAARFLTTEAYWGRWRTEADIHRQLASAWKLVSASDTDTGAMIGMARAVSDGVALAYLADVYVDRRYRGLGIGRAMVACMVEGGPEAHFRWLLHTNDAHALYRPFGFREADPLTVMELPHFSEREAARAERDSGHN